LSVYHLIDALPAAFFGLLGIWAAVVRRHWFLRFSVVCVFLLVCLLIPAYEVVIEFGIAIALIMTGVWLARGRRHEPFRFSLESALLAMVVVAIGSAVMAKAPEFGWSDWLNLFSIGAAVALISLLCLWLVFGQARLSRRLPLGLLGLLVFTALYYFSSATHYLLLEPEWSFAWVKSLWQRAIDPKVLSWGLGHCIPTSLLGFTTLCSVLVLTRSSRWFAVSEGDLPQPTNNRTQAARIGLVVLILCLFSPLCYLFYRLMTPMPYPVVEMPVDNGWDDLVAAGDSNDFDYSSFVLSTQYGFKAEGQQSLSQVRNRLELIDQALSNTRFSIGKYKNSAQNEKERWALYGVKWLLLGRFYFSERFESLDVQIAQLLPLLQLCKQLNKDVGFDWYRENEAEIHCRFAFKRMLVKLNSQQCRSIVAELVKYDRERGSLENRLYYQRLADENSGWLKHLRLLMQEWSGKDPYAEQSQQYQFIVRHMRMQIAQFALQQFFLEHNRLPETLAELVPEYLPAILIDPHTNQPLHYQHLWGGYALTTQDEDAGDRALVTGPAAPYLWQRLQASWQGFRTWLEGFPTTPR